MKIKGISLKDLAIYISDYLRKNGIEEGNRILRLLSPTDCVKDRLAAFYHWDDRQSLDQAILVCRDNNVDLKEIERWSLNEGMKNKFEAVRKELES